MKTGLHRVVEEQRGYWREFSHRISFFVCLPTVAETFCEEWRAKAG